MNNNSLAKYVYNEFYDFSNLNKSHKYDPFYFSINDDRNKGLLCYFKNSEARISYLFNKNLDEDLKEATPFTTKSLFQQPYTFNSPDATLIVSGEMCSNHDITIIAKNLIVSGKINTSKKLKLAIKKMLIFEENGSIYGKEKSELICPEIVRTKNVEFIK